MKFFSRGCLFNFKTILQFFTVSSLIVISGCSTYQNITGYFNTYYNAGKLFSEAEDEILKTPQTLRDSNYFAAFTVPKATEDKLDKVIEKCSKIIQFYPKSSWVDNAILMIGKSYIYKGESESGLRQCSELMQNFSTSNLRFEAQLWASKAQYHMKKEDEVLKITKDLAAEARSEGKDDILLETLMLEAQIFFDRGEYDAAANSYAAAVEISGENKLRAYGQNQLAVALERQGKTEKAAEAYGKVKEYRPDFSVELRARLKEGSMRSLAGQNEKALDALDNLKQEQLRPEQKALVELETANTYKRMGDTARAFALYTLIDTTYKRTEASAKSYYQQGLVNEIEYLDFKSALAFYDRAKNEFAAADITPMAQQKAQDLALYFSHTKNLAMYDSLLTVALHTDSATSLLKADSTAPDSASRWRRDSLAAKYTSDTTRSDSGLRAQVAKSPFSDSTVRKDSSARMAVSETLKTGVRDSSHVASVIPDSSGQNLKPPEPPSSLSTVRKDSSARMAVSETLKTGVRDSSHVASVIPDSLAVNLKPPESPSSLAKPPPEAVTPYKEMGAGYAGRKRGMVMRDSLRGPGMIPDSILAHSGRAGGLRDSLFAGKDSLKNMARSAAPIAAAKLSPDTLRSLIAKSEFELAGLFFLELNVNDSALFYYGKMVEENPSSPLVPRALYAMAEIHRSRNDSAVVDSIYNVILDKYGESDYAHQVKRLRGLEVAGSQSDSAAVEYQEAESLLLSGKTDPAIKAFWQLAKVHPASPFAPKALYTVGWIFETMLVQNDTAASCYKELIKKYPTSLYAVEAQPKVAVKDDPKSLSQFIKIKEIQPMAKKPTGKAVKADSTNTDENDQNDEEIQDGKRRNQNPDEDQQDDDAEPPPESDDNNN